MHASTYEVRPIGTVESPLVDRHTAPRQGDEGSPEAWMVFDGGVVEGIRDFNRRRIFRVCSESEFECEAVPGR